MKIISREDPISNNINFWIIEEGRERTTLVVKPLQIEKESYLDGFVLPEPTFRLSKVEAQAICQSLLDQLIDMGYRPNNDKLAGKIEAQSDHLKDVQNVMNALLKKVVSD